MNMNMKITPFKPFTWLQHNGKEILPEDMKTSHLFNTVRAVYNSFAPPHKRVPGGKLWRFNQPTEYLRRAMFEMLTELVYRWPELTSIQFTQLKLMSQTADEIATLQIKLK